MKYAASLLVMAALAGACLEAGAAPSEAQLRVGRGIVTSTCAVCHTLERGAGASEGPPLFGVVGRPVASVAGFNYTAGLKQSLSGKTWTAPLLDAFLTDTQKLAPNTGMTYFNDDAATRAAIIQYLSTLN